jgi:hypothetical protein
MVYNKRPPRNSLVVKSLINQRLPLSLMDLQPWVTHDFKPLDMFGIQGYPHVMPNKSDKWLPKFPGNNVISVEEHIDSFYAFFKITHLIMMMKM